MVAYIGDQKYRVTECADRNGFIEVQPVHFIQ